MAAGWMVGLRILQEVFLYYVNIVSWRVGLPSCVAELSLYEEDIYTIGMCS